jgi:hypothetical protein
MATSTTATMTLGAPGNILTRWNPETHIAPGEVERNFKELMETQDSRAAEQTDEWVFAKKTARSQAFKAKREHRGSRGANPCVPA